MQNPFLPSPDKSYSEMSQEEQAQLGARRVMEFVASCPGKTVLSGVSGYVLGGFFGMFISSMQYDQPFGTSMNQIVNLPMKEQMRIQFKDMGRQISSSAKNFGYMGMVYSAVECVLQSFRAKDDMINGSAAGCITGAGLAIKSGPVAAFTGCAGFAAFSVAVDAYLRSDYGAPPEDDYSK